ncbi:hypothetical protein NIES2104_48760 [Leptolyngbya sp. NIES-2104]|nr:hypothetical protein NIES2104_48760 [Leptolyngbya sp. NIES-2104]
MITARRCAKLNAQLDKVVEEFAVEKTIAIHFISPLTSIHFSIR